MSTGRSFLPGLIKPVHADPTAWSKATNPEPAKITPVPVLPVPATTPGYQQPPVPVFPAYMGAPPPIKTMPPNFPPPLGVYPPFMGMQPPGFYLPPVAAPPVAVPPVAPVVFKGSEEQDFAARQVSSDGTIEEQLFPPGRVADLEKTIATTLDKGLIGLEFVIEIQHNTIKPMQNSYMCLLCDHHIKIPKDNMTTIAMALAHIKSSIHKLLYVKKYFPRIREQLIGNKKPVDHNLVNSLIAKIVEKFGLMKVKIVVGQKLFKKKAQEIKTMIEKSSHHCEDDAFVVQVCGEPIPALKPATSKNRIDDYADAFDAFEKEEKNNSTGKSATEKSDVGSSSGRGESSRSLDKVPIKDSNPIVEKKASRARSPPKILKQTRSRSPTINSRARRSVSRSSRTSRRSRSRSPRPRQRKSHSRSPRRKRSRSPRSRRSQTRSPRRPSRSRSRERKKPAQKSRYRDRESRSRERESRTHDKTSRNRRSLSRDEKKSSARRSNTPSHSQQGSKRSRSQDRDSRKNELSKRSRSRDRDSRKNERSKRSLSPIAEKKKSRTPEFEISIVKLQAELDGRVKRFIGEDRVLFTELESEKNHYKENPETHPNYTEEWRRFYNSKCVKHGAKINPASLKTEWADEWVFFLNQIFDRRLTRRREEIMDVLRLRKDDIEDFLLRQKLEAEKVPASPVSSEDNVPAPKKDLGFSRDDVNVLNTLRLLSAIEHLLGDLGIEIIQNLGRANTIEISQGKGESVKLLDDKPFFKMLHETRKRLQAKLIEAKIPEKSLNVVRICLDHITILLQQSRCVLTPPPQPAKEDPDAHLKKVIGQTIRDEYFRAGHNLTPEQLDILVKTQLDRVCERRNRPRTPVMAVQSHAPLIALKPASALLTVKSESSLLTVRPNSSLFAAPNSQSKSQDFDWELLQSTVSNLKGSNSIVKQERLEPEPEPEPAAPLINVKKERFESYREEVVEQASNVDEEEGYDDLTVEELVSLFQNFKELDKENQEQLIIYMKKLETSNPDKVALIKLKIQGI